MINALVVGCGSMGKRRIRDLLSLGVNVLAFDTREDRREEIKLKFGIDTTVNVESALSRNLDAMIVSTPPFLHARYVKIALKAGLNVFSEAPLAISIEDLLEIENLAKTSSKLVAPSCTYLHHFFNRQARELLESGTIGPPLGFRLHFGNHLADWHPYEGLKFYASDRKNGGMGFDVLVHHLQLADSLVGPIESVVCMAAKRSSLEEVYGYDMYDLLLQCRKTSVTVHCDVVQRPPTTNWSLWGEEGTINWSWENMQIYDTKSRAWRLIELPPDFNYEKMYRAEIAHFLDATGGKMSYPHPLAHERIVLEVMLGAEQSAQSGKALSFK